MTRRFGAVFWSMASRYAMIFLPSTGRGGISRERAPVAMMIRSEERRVGREGRCGWGRKQENENEEGTNQGKTRSGSDNNTVTNNRADEAHNGPRERNE